MAVIKGSCYCGECQFEVNHDDPLDGVACYCRTCQKLHTSSSYNLGSKVDKVKMTKGSPTVYDDSKADAGKAVHRSFCSKCGSALFSDPESMPGTRFVKVGVLENAKDFKLAAEIYVESALPHNLVDKKKFGQKHFEGMMAKEV